MEDASGNQAPQEDPLLDLVVAFYSIMYLLAYAFFACMRRCRNSNDIVTKALASRTRSILLRLTDLCMIIAITISTICQSKGYDEGFCVHVKWSIVGSAPVVVGWMAAACGCISLLWSIWSQRALRKWEGVKHMRGTMTSQ